MYWCAIWDFVVEYGGKALNVLGGLSGLFLLVVGGAQLCGKKWLDSWFEKKNKDYQKEIDKEVEKYKSELDAKNREIQNHLDLKLELLRVEYGTLYSKRLEAIRRTHKYVITLKNITTLIAARSVSDNNTKTDNSELETYISWAKSIKDKEELFYLDKILFKKEIARKIDMLHYITFNMLGSLIPNNFVTALNSVNNLSEEEISDLKQYLHKLGDYSKVLDKVSGNVLEKLEDEFRHLAGVNR